MTVGEGDIDFKPFFDMVVGVIFILLILVAAQLFVARFANESQVEPQPDIRRELFEEERAAFLDELAARLQPHAPGARVDHATQTLSFPVAPLLAAPPPGGQSTGRTSLDPVRAAGVAGVLVDQLSCVTPARGPGCPPLRMLQLMQTEGVALSGPAEGVSALGRARLLGATLAAALLNAHGTLLELRTQGGEPAFPVGFTAQPVGEGEGAGQIELRFVFADPLALPKPPPKRN